MKAIILASGGIDSITSAYFLRAEGYDLHILCFDYGQRQQKKELVFAEYHAKQLQARFDRIDLKNIGPFLKSAVRTELLPVVDGLGKQSLMTLKITPNRNAILLSIAYAVAVAEQAQRVVIGIHVGEQYVYPDCRPSFVAAFDTMQHIALEGFGEIRLVAPFMFHEKHHIIQLGAALHVSYEHTWSCYHDGENHCGSCKACSERRQAFELAGVIDPTHYETELKTFS
ncbi:MAG TPA: 7-cyano-7-deazaguanine synthase QueC [Ktedonobacteraceae bacterium]